MFYNRDKRSIIHPEEYDPKRVHLHYLIRSIRYIKSKLDMENLRLPFHRIYHGCYGPQFCNYIESSSNIGTENTSLGPNPC